MAGPAIRSFEFARQLSRQFDVSLLAPQGSTSTDESIALYVADPTNAETVTRLARRFDVVVAQRLPVEAMRRLASDSVQVVYDLYVPLVSESLAYLASAGGSQQLAKSRLELGQRSYETALACGDAFVCASERQRDFLLGELATIGRLSIDGYVRDADFRQLVDVVPFGVEETPFTGRPGVLRERVAGIGRDDKLILWGGGIWNWFDPLTAIRAVEQLAAKKRGVKLYFMGLKHPAGHDDLVAMSGKAIEYARGSGLENTVVFFNFGWTPYEDRVDVLADSAIGISCHHPGIETRFAFRTRLLDYFWAGLPTVCTRGDVLGELVERRAAGIAIDPGDVNACAAALAKLLDDESAHASAARQAKQLACEYSWSRVTEPLVRLCEQSSTVAPPGVSSLAIGVYHAQTLRDALRREGLMSTMKRTWQKATS